MGYVGKLHSETLDLRCQEGDSKLADVVGGKWKEILQSLVPTMK